MIGSRGLDIKKDEIIWLRKISEQHWHYIHADEAVLNEQDKINYHTFKPVLFEFPPYEYFVTGEKVGNCGKMN